MPIKQFEFEREIPPQEYRKIGVICVSTVMLETGQE